MEKGGSSARRGVCGGTWPGSGLQGEAYATLNHSAAVTKTSTTTSTSRFQGDLRARQAFPPPPGKGQADKGSAQNLPLARGMPDIPGELLQECAHLTPRQKVGVNPEPGLALCGRKLCS